VEGRLYGISAESGYGSPVRSGIQSKRRNTRGPNAFQLRKLCWPVINYSRVGVHRGCA